MVSGVLPRQVAGVYDGPCYQVSPSEVPAGSFVFSVGWHADFAGRGYEDVCRLATREAARAAAAREDWASPVAHVRDLPVVSVQFEYVVTPSPLPAHVGWRDGVTAAAALAAVRAALAEGAPQVLADFDALAGGGREPCDCGCCPHL